MATSEDRQAETGEASTEGGRVEAMAGAPEGEREAAEERVASGGALVGIELASERPPERLGHGGGAGSGKLRRWLGRTTLALAVLVAIGAVSVAAVFYVHGRDLPGFEAVTDYDPPQVTKVFDQNGVQIAEFFRERRSVVPLEEIPPVMRQAMVSAEDGNFYAHDGLDYLGILRALIIDLKEMRLAQGASTITQQVIKNMVLSPERSFARKIKEAILARRLEQNLSKDELLSIYLNHIYFGHGRYGIGEAARFYFDKAPRELDLGEAALLAGLPQSPNNLSPLRNPARAKRRQRYVLDQMALNGFITRQEAEREMARPIAAVGREVESVGPHYVEAIRRQLLNRYGDRLLYEGGLRVEVAMDARLQKAAQAAVARGLEALERKRGLTPPQHVLHPEAWQAMRAKFVASAGEKPLRALPVGEPISLEEASSAAGGDMKERAGEAASRAGEAADEAQTEVAPPVVGWDFARLPLADLARLCAGQDVAFDEASRAFAASWGSKIARQRLEPGVTLVAPLKGVDARALSIDLGGAVGRVDRASLSWARLGPKTSLPLGGLYRVRVLAEHPRPSKKARRLSEEEARQVPLELVPLPTVQAALVA
ncbi:MAG: transglycosylase domain-containing protein, partial [Myxococcaceae bacterium]|nr:transglycosylase domain-containing protein [Myxococcaceae bacterium]